ncbi:hypothetical protein MASR1M90_10550 [Desulfovibrionales bacterium]
MSLPHPIQSQHTKKTGTHKAPFILGGLCALLCAQVLYGALVLSALHKQYAKPMQAVQALVCQELGNRLGRMTRLGKEPARIAQLDAVLTPYASGMMDSLMVLDGQRKVLAGWGQDLGTLFVLPEERHILHNNIETFSWSGHTWLSQPLKNQDENIVGHIVLGMDSAKQSARIWPILHNNIVILALTTCAAGLFLVLVVMRIPFFSRDADFTSTPHFPRKRLYASLLIPLVASQLVFAVAMLEPLRQTSAAHLDTVGQQLGRHFQGELEHVLHLGLSLEQLPPVTDHLRDLQSFLPESAGLGLFTNQDQLMHAANAQGALSAQDWNTAQSTAVRTDIPVTGPDGQRAGTISVLMSSLAITKNVWSITLDTLTMTVVAMLFLAEIISMLVVREERRFVSQAPPLAASPAFMRTIMFLCLFAIDLSLSFVPLRVGELDATLFDLPTDVVLGLPVSVEMLMVGTAILSAGFISEKTGWRPLLLIGTCIAALGNLGSGLADHALLYIASRGLAGAGYGLINLAAQVFVLAYSRPDQRAGNLATVFAGLFAGALCGSASGGLIADRLGYGAAFLVAALLLGLICLGLWRILPEQRPSTAPSKNNHQALPTLRDIWACLTDLRLAALLWLNIIPSALITVCLFQFFIPVSLNQAGASPADIGRVVMIFPLVVIYFGPFLGRLVDTSSRKYRPLALAGLLGAASVAMLLITDGIPITVAAIMLLGLANAVFSNAQGAYALELPITEHFGSARIVGIYNVAERLGQVIGPIGLGVILSVWGRTTGLSTLALGCAVMTLLFALISSVAWRKQRAA